MAVGAHADQLRIDGVRQATTLARPPIQPAHGLIAFETPANVVPRSGSARFM